MAFFQIKDVEGGDPMIETSFSATGNCQLPILSTSARSFLLSLRGVTYCFDSPESVFERSLHKVLYVPNRNPSFCLIYDINLSSHRFSSATANVTASSTTAATANVTCTSSSSSLTSSTAATATCTISTATS